MFLYMSLKSFMEAKQITLFDFYLSKLSHSYLLSEHNQNWNLPETELLLDQTGPYTV